MQSKAATVDQYLAALPEDRRAALQAVREVILKNLSPEFEEGMQYGMIGYYVPHSVYPPGYHCDPKQPLPFAGLASQKNHMSIHLMCVYGNAALEAWFRAAWAKTGKKLDMGKACVRFKKLDDLALEVVGETVKRVTATKFIAYYEEALKAIGKRKSSEPAATATKKKAATKPAIKKGAKKPVTKPAPKKTAKKTAAKKATSKTAKKASRR